MIPTAPLPKRAGVAYVGSFAELLATPLSAGVNALCWPRVLSGDYAAVAASLAGGEAIDPLDETRLLALDVGPAGRVAVQQLLADLRLLRDQGLEPALNCINGYPRDEAAGLIATDVFSFHADSAPFAADTWLCTYFGPASEGLSPGDAVRRVDQPATRAALLKAFGGADGAEFREFLQENCYDLHYVPKPGAQPYGFGLGNLWRIATDYPGSPVPPCVHRAPSTRPGDPPRLLLIS